MDLPSYSVRVAIYLFIGERTLRMFESSFYLFDFGIFLIGL